jgi:hypothetical protein
VLAAALGPRLARGAAGGRGHEVPEAAAEHGGAAHLGGTGGCASLLPLRADARRAPQLRRAGRGGGLVRRVRAGRHRLRRAPGGHARRRAARLRRVAQAAQNRRLGGEGGQRDPLPQRQRRGRSLPGRGGGGPARARLGGGRRGRARRLHEEGRVIRGHRRRHPRLRRGQGGGVRGGGEARHRCGHWCLGHWSEAGSLGQDWRGGRVRAPPLKILLPTLTFPPPRSGTRSAGTASSPS